MSDLFLLRDKLEQARKRAHEAYLANYAKLIWQKTKPSNWPWDTLGVSQQDYLRWEKNDDK